MTKHTTEEDRSLTAQLLVSKSDPSDDDICSEKIWSKGGFYRDERNNFGIKKVNYPENTLFYVNQAYLTVQKSENIFYSDHFILGQVIPASNVPTDVDSYKCGPGEVKVL